MTDFVVPFNRVTPFGREIEYVQQAIQRGHISGHGPFTSACEKILEEVVGASRILLTTSGTHALELCALLLDIQPGDEIILPSFTFVSTANAFVLRGGHPVFVDVRDDTLNIDERLVAGAITSRTKAIVAVHYAGIGCEVEALGAAAASHGVPVVEDNAHGLFGRYRGRPLGAFGRVGALSFHETKNVSCGEGGAILVNDPELVERAEILREKGTNRSRFLRGEVDKYTWMDLGSSCIPSELLAGFLLGQLEARDVIQGRRRDVFARYDHGLGDWARRHGVRTPVVPDGCEQSYHMYYLRLPDVHTRAMFISALRERGILAVSHYVPLHLSPMGRRFGYRQGELPVTERASEQLVRLPFFAALSETDQQLVIETASQFDLAGSASEITRG